MEKPKSREKQRGSTVENERSEEAKKQRTIKAERQGKAEKREAESRKGKKQGNRNLKKCPKQTNKIPPCTIIKYIHNSVY